MKNLIFPPLARLEAFQRQTFSCWCVAHISSSILYKRRPSPVSQASKNRKMWSGLGRMRWRQEHIVGGSQAMALISLECVLLFLQQRKVRHVSDGVSGAGEVLWAWYWEGREEEGHGKLRGN